MIVSLTASFIFQFYVVSLDSTKQELQSKYYEHFMKMDMGDADGDDDGKGKGREWEVTKINWKKIALLQ